MTEIKSIVEVSTEVRIVLIGEDIDLPAQKQRIETVVVKKDWDKALMGYADEQSPAKEKKKATDNEVLFTDPN